MPDDCANAVGSANAVGNANPDEAYRLPNGESPVSVMAAPTALARPSETGIPSSVSETSPESEDTGSLEGELSSLRRRLEKAEKMLRGVQSRYDVETARLRQQLKEQRRQAPQDIASQMQSAGVEPSPVTAFRRAPTEGKAMEDLQEQARQVPSLHAQLAVNQSAQHYIREMCDAADVDPSDPRLDLSTPNTFRASLNQIKAERKKNTEPTLRPPLGGTQNPEKRERRSARLDLDVLGGGVGAAIHELPDDPEELWKLAKRETPSLRERA